MSRYIQKLIEEGEHQRLDFKFEITDARRLARTLVAFANTDGGRLLIGVKDNGAVAGVRSAPGPDRSSRGSTESPLERSGSSGLCTALLLRDPGTRGSGMAAPEGASQEFLRFEQLPHGFTGDRLLLRPEGRWCPPDGGCRGAPGSKSEGLSPDPESEQNDCRLGGFRADRDCPPGRGAPVSGSGPLDPIFDEHGGYRTGKGKGHEKKLG